MELSETSNVTLVSLAVAYAMVVLGLAKRRLALRRRCGVCGGPQLLCRCRRPG